jgi:hypothetical protein
MGTINVAWWNLEKLFDTDDDPISQDFEFTQANGWTPELYAARRANLAAKPPTAALHPRLPHPIPGTHRPPTSSNRRLINNPMNCPRSLTQPTRRCTLHGRVCLDEGTLRRTAVGVSTRRCRPVGEAHGRGCGMTAGMTHSVRAGRGVLSVPSVVVSVLVGRLVRLRGSLVMRRSRVRFPEAARKAARQSHDRQFLRVRNGMT